MPRLAGLSAVLFLFMISRGTTHSLAGLALAVVVVVVANAPRGS